MLLQVSHVNKLYAAQVILEDVSFIVNAGDRVGLVGPNGSGKTTLLRIITGGEPADSGYARLDTNATVGYLPQGLLLTSRQTVGEHLRSGIAGLDAARRQVEMLAERMSFDSSPKVVQAYGDALASFEALGGYDIEHRMEEILAGLGLTSLDPNTPLETLSGGQRTRVGLARLLLANPNLLILDEPTNHLDIQALEWLERFLAGYAGGTIVVSHDWAFLDATVSRILELDERTHHVAEYAGNYSDYALEKSRQVEKQWSAWSDQQDEIARLKGAAAHLRGLAKFRRGGKADSGDKFAKGFFADRGLETVRRAKRIEARLEELMTDERIEKPKESWRMKLEFGEMPRSGQTVVALEDLGHAFGERWLFRHADLVLRHGERVALVGGNGSGKTTLLRLIVGELTPIEGLIRLGANVRLGYMPQEQENLNLESTPLGIIREIAAMDETAARHLLHFFLFQGDEVFTRVGQLSYGERARLLLAKLVVAGANCLLLDEPINHLDIASREQFESALDAFPGTILIAVHDRAFIDRFATSVWSPDPAMRTLKRYVDRADAGM